MNINDLRKLSADDLKKRLDETKTQLFNLRFQHATKQLENTASLPLTRAEVARIKTLLKEKERGV